MEKAGQPTLGELIRDAVTHLRLPAIKPAGAGENDKAERRLPDIVLRGRATASLSLLIGLSFFDPAIIPEGYMLGDSAVADYARRPEIKSNPIGYFLSHCVLSNPDETLELAKKIGLREALQSESFRPAFARFSVPLLDEALESYRIHQAEMCSEDKIRSAVGSRFKELWRVLEAEQFDGETFNECLQSAQDNVEADELRRNPNRVTKVFHPKRRKKAIELDPRTVLDALVTLGRRKKHREKAFRADLARAAKVEPDEEEEQLRPPDPDRIKKGSRLIGGSHLRADAWNYVCAMPPVRMLGRAQMSLILTAIAKMSCDEDVLLCMIFYCFVARQHLSSCELFHDDNLGTKRREYVRTKVTLPQKAPEHPELYVHVGEYLERPIPTILYHRFLVVRNAPGFTRILERLDYRLKEILPYATVAKVTQTLISQGPAWWGLPAALLEYGLRVNRIKRPAHASYTSLTPQIIYQAREYLALLRSYPVDPLPKCAATGSALCPNVEVVKRLFRVWRKYFRVLRTATPEDTIRHWNIVAAGLHLLCLLILGLRNHPMGGLPADLARDLSDWGLIQQKEPVSYYVADFLREILRQGRQIWDSVKNRLADFGYKIHEDRSYAFAYGFLGLERALRTGGKFRVFYRSPSYRRVVSGLWGSRWLEEAAKLDRKALRHFTNTQLREAGFFEALVRAYHSHHENMLSPFRRHREEPLVARETILPMQESMARKIGIL